METFINADAKNAPHVYNSSLSPIHRVCHFLNAKTPLMGA